MAGIYLHIPFCKRACHYCNFHFSTSLKLKNDFIGALLKEIDARKNYIDNEQVDTIYFGGGTPSLLTRDELASILEALHRQFNISPAAEVTLEANPDDIDAAAVASWRHLGINRMSIGIQSFFEDDLVWMNRAHNSAQARNCISVCQQRGINNLSIDLIYGGPTLSDDKWMRNMETAVQFNIPHLSCYALTVEPGTALDMMTRKKKLQPVSTDDQARQFLMMTDFLQAQGYQHYEISNLALPGKRSKHNTAYWNGKRYLGLGPSAHSFNGHSRQWNVANNALYIQAEGNSMETELLSEDQRFNEYIMTSLRTIEGINIPHITAEFGEKYSGKIVTGVKKFEDNKWIIADGGTITLTREGKLFADGIAADLFAV